MYGESNMETYIAICKIDSQREFAAWLRKLKQGLCINLEGWGGERDGREVQKGGDMCMYTCGCFMLRFDRKQQNSVEQLSFNKKKILKKQMTTIFFKTRLATTANHNQTQYNTEYNILPQSVQNSQSMWGHVLWRLPS